jgi:AmmeMemoRadiSam system protein A
MDALKPPVELGAKYGVVMMNDEKKQVLLKVARDTVEAVIRHQKITTPESDDPELNAPCGCFVTLKNHDRLRGCIGQFISDSPLIELVAEMAKASATGDPRFFADPITADELEKLDIEISVLSPLKRTDDPLSLKLGVDGIYIKRDRMSGCFLPQVATETGWSKEEFLSYCCAHKAGLAADAWKDPETEVYLFTAEVFGADFRDI